MGTLILDKLWLEKFQGGYWYRLRDLSLDDLCKNDCHLPDLPELLRTGKLNSKGGCCFTFAEVISLHIDYSGSFGFAIPVGNDVLIAALGEEALTIKPYFATTRVCFCN